MNKRIQALAEQAFQTTTFESLESVRLVHSKELESYTESILHQIYNLIGDEKLSNHYLNEEESNNSLDRLKSNIHDYFYANENDSRHSQ